MVVLLGDNIVSSLGFTTEENMAAVRDGRSGIAPGGDGFGPVEPFVASLIDRGRLAAEFAAVSPANGQGVAVTEKYTDLERAMIVSAHAALAQVGGDASSERTIFVVSTTKGNVELLGKEHPYDEDRVHLWRSAQLLAGFFGNANEPVVVSNACISGGSAQIVARRLLESGRYDTAVVVGGDVASRFIISGFQSFKALSPERCRPFDKSRTGLNLGEGAATMVLGRKETPDRGDIIVEGGAIRNDANHISGPSRTGEGLYNAIRATVGDIPAGEFAFVNAHGTATPYNDEMESIALTRAGMESVPVNSLKGYFGHTLGAAGVVEGVVAAHALREGFVPVSLGYSESGVSNPLDVVTERRTTDKSRCLKMLSGFGGCNAVVMYRVER